MRVALQKKYVWRIYIYDDRKQNVYVNYDLKIHEPMRASERKSDRILYSAHFSQKGSGTASHPSPIQGNQSTVKQETHDRNIGESSTCVRQRPNNTSSQEKQQINLPAAIAV